MLLTAILARPEAASAQLDPLLMIKKGTPASPVKPNIIFAIDTAPRMQNDANEVYYDPNDYVRAGCFLLPCWEDEPQPLTRRRTRYRRKYFNLRARTAAAATR